MSEDAALLDALHDFIPRAMKVCGTTGLSVALARHGEVCWEQGFGLADIASRRPMSSETVTRAGSMSKLYTAVAVLQMVEEGRLGLDEPLARYVDFPVENPLGDRPVTVRDLMQHRSGLTSDAAGCGHESVPPLAEYLRDAFASKTLDEYEGTVPRWSARVGERFEYSNVGISTLGYLVELANPEGLSCSDYIRRRILEPLGMSSSAFPSSQDPDSSVSLLARCSTGYAGYGPLVVATPPIRIAAYPAGALLTTAGDHLKLLLALLGGGVYGGARLLEQNSVDEMLRPAVNCGGGLWTGLVARIAKLNTLEENFGHWGAIMWGWYNGSAAFPRLDMAITVCTNTWPMITYLEEAAPTPAGLVIDFVSDWYAREAAGRAPSEARSAAWKTSYAAGLSMAERTKGVLGIADALPDDVLDAMVAATHAQDSWDQNGFRAGVADMLEVRQTPPDVAAFLASQEVRVSTAELTLINAEIGGRGEFSLPSELGSWLTSGPDDRSELEAVVEG
jgi:CubicO group peptidase (beta-lactamase class C family)